MIERQLSEAGYKLLGDKDATEDLILNILKTKNTRYLKAIPFLIYKHKSNISNIYHSIKSSDARILFQAILDITYKLFREFNIPLPEKILNCLNGFNKILSTLGLNYAEFRDEFELQLRNDNNPALFIDKQKIYAERDLQMHLTRLFTKKEKYIIKRLLEEKPISKTDYEYYSRKTKKKLNSIIGLGDLAKAIYSKTPRYDEGLYKLKRKLEEWLEKENPGEKITLKSFFIWDRDKISISFNKNSQQHNTQRNFNDMDHGLLELIHRYKKHDFT